MLNVKTIISTECRSFVQIADRNLDELFILIRIMIIIFTIVNLDFFSNTIRREPLPYNSTNASSRILGVQTPGGCGFGPRRSPVTRSGKISSKQ